MSITTDEIREIHESVKRLTKELSDIQDQFDGMPDEEVPHHLKRAKAARRQLNNIRRKRGRLY